MDSSTEKYCPFQQGIEESGKCGDWCPMHRAAGCAFAQIPAILKNIEMEARETRIELEKIDGRLQDLDGTLSTISERIPNADTDR